MRFRAINLAAYGPFTDYRIALPAEPDFHIIYGPNEAGKSSALRALISALYGIPMRTGDNFIHDNNKLKIGIEVENQAQSLALFRLKRLKNSLIDAESEQPIDDRILEQLLASVNQTVFENLFGLDHQRLRDGGQKLLEDGGDLGFSIFSAATGIDRLQQILSRIEHDSKAVFIPQKNGRGSLNQAIQNYKQAREEEQSKILWGREWQELERCYQIQKQELENLSSRIEELETLYRRYLRIKNCAPDVIRREELLCRIKQLGDVVVLDPDFTEQRQLVENRIGQAVRDRHRAEQKCAQLRDELAQIEIPNQLLARADEIKTLVEQLDSYRSKVQNLPALEWNLEQLTNEALAQLKSINPDEADLGNAAEYLIPLLVRTTLKELLAERETVTNRLAEAKAGLFESRQELNAIQSEIEKLGAVPDHTNLEIALHNGQRDSKLEQALRDNQLAQDQLMAEISSDILRLGLWQGSYQELAVLPVPAAAVVKEYAVQIQQLTSELKYLNDQIKQLGIQLEDAEMQLLRIESQGKVPTKADLDSARRIREQGWRLVKRAWLEGKVTSDQELEFTKGRPLADVYEHTVQQADAIADAMYKEARNVGQKQALLNSIRQLKTKLAELQQLKQNLEQKRETLLAEWVNEWRDTQIQPLAPEEMNLWLEQRQQILVKVGELAKLKAAANHLAAAKSQLITALTDALHSVGADFKQTQSLTELLAQAEVINRKLKERAQKLEFLRQSKKNAENRTHRQAQGVKNYEAALEEIEAECRANLAKTRLPVDADLNAVGIYLDKIAELEQLLRAKAEQENSLALDRKFTANYESQVRLLIDACAPDLYTLSPDLALQSLNKRLQAAEQKLVYREQLAKQLREEEQIIKQAELEIADAEQELAQLMQTAQVHDLTALKLAEQKSQEYLSLGEQLREIEDRLLQTGTTLEQLAAEIQETEIDSLDSKIENLAAEIERLKAEKDTKLTEFGKTEARYEEFCRGTNTAALEAREKAESLLAVIKDQGAEYLKLRAALVLLKKAIERYRDQNQGPIINATAKIFAKLTLGSFVRLRIDTDARGRTIVLGVRANGEEVPVTGMSDGTRDQLYLALRLAAIEHHLTQNEPLPLICDDLLVNFDDERSLAALKILADLAGKTQVIFFTHHSKIIEQAQKHLPKQVVVHRLGTAGLLDTREQQSV